MKLSKKKVLVAALVVSLFAILSYGTLAWFQYSDTAQNIFKVSTDQQTSDVDFQLDLFEHEVKDDGTLGTSEVDTNTYENIAPGDNLLKDPTVRNDGAYDQWVRIKVTLDDYNAWSTALGQTGVAYDFSSILTGVSSDWTLDPTTVGTATLVYYKNTALTPGSTSKLFDGVSIPTAFTVDNIPTQFNINIVADAIQADNTGSSAKAAFDNYWS